MKKIAALALSLFLSSGIAFADTPADTPKDADAQPAKPAAPKAKAGKTDISGSAIAAEIEELRQAIQAQQEELQLLKEELAKRDRQIDEARDAAAAANAKATEASSKAAEAVNSTTEVKSEAAAISNTVSDLKTTVDTVANSQADQNKQDPENGYSIRYKGITFSPGGFLAAESVSRQRAAQADINTPFTGIPFPGNDLSRVTENNFTGRQSRLSFLAEGKADNVKLSGYYEMDWLGACVTSNSRQSNSYCLRQRQVWGQGAFSNGWTVTGGQQWSLATETRKGMDNRTEALPMTIDPQYHVGFTWERQYGFRITKNFNDKAWLGFAVEEPQLTLTQHGSPTPFLVGGVGAGGGLLNFADTTGYSNNPMPDFILKAAVEPGWGHYEVFGIVSDFRARTYPCGPTTTAILLPTVCGGVGANGANAFSNNSMGGGIGINARAPITKQLDLGLHVLGGDGVGRYSSAQLPDVTVRPDGSLALIRGGSALGTIEVHPNSKLDIYVNYGVEYAFRAGYTYLTNPATGTPATVAVGYGSPFFNNAACEALPPQPAGAGAFGNTNITGGFNPSSAGGCIGDIRNIQEGTIGFWHKLYQGPKGGLRWGLQYSYLTKNAWSGNNSAGNINPALSGINAKAVDNMFFTSFRYYIP